MSRAALSIRAFGVYLMAVAAVLVFIPNTLFAVTGVPATDEAWIRVAGVLAGVLAYYYLMLSGRDCREFYRWTVIARLMVLGCFSAFVLVGVAPTPLLIFGIVDGAAALWTHRCLRETD